MTDTGGLAYPTMHVTIESRGVTSTLIESGMTLLDHFAGLAIQEVLHEQGMGDDGDNKLLAKDCYGVAEAMIAEKRRREADDGEET